MSNDILIGYRDGVHPSKIVAQQIPLFEDMSTIIFVTSFPEWCNVYNERAKGTNRTYRTTQCVDVEVIDTHRW